jgi:hypothetical protein
VPHATLGGMLCATCHNGTSATGISTNHIPLSGLGDCGTCHTQTTTSNFSNWAGAVYSHSPAPTTCQNCHNGTYATGKASYAAHVVTTLDCISCHTPTNTSNFANWLNASGYDHSALTSASTCVTSSCHNGVTAKGVSSGHIPLPSGLPNSCGNGCHAVYNGTGVISFAPGTMVHSLYTAARCDSCHSGSYTAQGLNGGAMAKMAGLGSGNHIPTTPIATGLDCTYCHTTLTAATVSSTSGAGGWAPEVTNHALATGTGCAACHEASKGYYLSKMTLNSSSHHSGTSCTSCHSTKKW